MKPRQWLTFALALALALTVALGIGLWMRHRNGFGVTQWLHQGETLNYRGNEFSIEGFGQIPAPPADEVTLPSGAVVVRLDLRQEVFEVPDERYELSCTITLHTRQASWPLDWDLPGALDAETDCAPTTVGEIRTVSGIWAVPPEVLEQDPWVEVRFHANREAFAVRP